MVALQDDYGKDEDIDASFRWEDAVDVAGLLMMNRDRLLDVLLAIEFLLKIAILLKFHVD